ncbi:MAG TPA: uroporphyrinogen-III C-methyltransferase [Burkholderiales bacterium]
MSGVREVSGTVYLVGAGPGAADLLTVRAARLLRGADIVFYDALVSKDIVGLAVNAEKIQVGKRSGKRSTAQHFINKRLADAARCHQVVVRLKGGDPMLFGRAQDEISYLNKHGIAVQVVPGVTAALAASADLRVSLTQRGVSRSVVFATPRAAPDEAPSNWAAAVAAADTAVLYMAAGMAEQVRAELIAAGVSAAKPVAVVENASVDARIQSGVLAELGSFATGEKPVLVLLGDVYAALAAAREPQRAGEERHEPGERPLGDRQTEEAPVHLRAFPAARK